MRTNIPAPPGLQRRSNTRQPLKRGSNSVSNYSNGSEFAAEIGRREKALELFFELRERRYIHIVGDLFKLYSFQDIAQGVYKKYRILPAGWERDLVYLKKENDPSLFWFNPNKVQFLTETTEQYPAVNRRISFPERNRKVDAIVDEFIENEKAYFDKLNAFNSCFCAELITISSGNIGKEAERALGMNKAQVDFAFGNALTRVIKASESFLTMLEPLILVGTAPNIPGGRPAHLAHLMLAAGPSMVKAYAPFNAQSNLTRKVIVKTEEKVRTSQKTSPAPGRMVHLNFLELWHEISVAKPSLKNSKIEAVLMQPIRRFPNYKVFFEQLLKDIPKNDPAIDLLEQTRDKVVEFTHTINEEFSKREGTLSLLAAQLLSDI